MAGVLRVVDTGPGEPAWNMAVDEALLHAATQPTLRLYRWAPPGLSLGWFQDAATFAALPGPHRVVRRRTGGGAIYHDDELTFALALDPALLPGAVAAGYAVVHGAVARALARVGVETRVCPAGAGCLRGARARHAWCFARPGAGDLLLVCSGRKLVGSAQRRLRLPRPRLLHHGSLVLTAPAATPFCGAVAEVADPRRVEADLARHLADELASALGLRPALAEGLEAHELAAARAALAEAAAVTA